MNGERNAGMKRECDISPTTTHSILFNFEFHFHRRGAEHMDERECYADTPHIDTSRARGPLFPHSMPYYFLSVCKCSVLLFQMIIKLTIKIEARNLCAKFQNWFQNASARGGMAESHISISISTCLVWEENDTIDEILTCLLANMLAINVNAICHMINYEHFNFPDIQRILVIHEAIECWLPHTLRSPFIGIHSTLYFPFTVSQY